MSEDKNMDAALERAKAKAEAMKAKADAAKKEAPKKKFSGAFPYISDFNIPANQVLKGDKRSAIVIYHGVSAFPIRQKAVNILL